MAQKSPKDNGYEKKLKKELEKLVNESPNALAKLTLEEKLEKRIDELEVRINENEELIYKNFIMKLTLYFIKNNEFKTDSYFSKINKDIYIKSSYLAAGLFNMNDKYKAISYNYNKLIAEVKELKDKIIEDQNVQANLKKNYSIIIMKLLKDREKNEKSQKENSLILKEKLIESYEKMLILEKELYESEKKALDETKIKLLNEINDLKDKLKKLEKSKLDETSELNSQIQILKNELSNSRKNFEDELEKNKENMKISEDKKEKEYSKLQDKLTKLVEETISIKKIIPGLNLEKESSSAIKDTSINIADLNKIKEEDNNANKVKNVRYEMIEKLLKNLENSPNTYDENNMKKILEIIDEQNN